MAFDPDRRGGQPGRPNDADEKQYRDEHARQQMAAWHDRQPTDGPGGAASFYPSSYTPDEALGSGTDGFGAGQNRRAPAAQPNQHPPSYAQETDYRSTYGGADQGATQLHHDGAHRAQPHRAANGGVGSNQYDTLVPGRPAYLLPHQDNTSTPTSPYHYSYNNTAASSKQNLSENDDDPDERRYPASYAKPSYPPQNVFANSQSTFDLRTPFTAAGAAATNGDRPDTPGIYRDRAPRMEKLSPEQRKIAESFPKDLDEEGGSLLKTFIAMCKNWRSFIKWKYAHYYIILAIICALVAVMTIYHHQIVDWLTPVSRKIRELVWGWIIPVIILFVISFPPLFGHEIVGVLCGVVYGLWIGFGILSLGTLLGELGNFYAFKYFLRKHGEKYEQKSIDYACMAHIVREGGFIVILMARLSAIPGHFTTAVFATVGMNIFIFTLAAALSLPKQLVVVYLGVAIEQSGSGTETTQSKVIKWVVLVGSFLVTVGVAVFLYGKMQKARPVVQERLREKRYRMLSEAAQRNEEDVHSGMGHGTSPSEEGFVQNDLGAKAEGKMEYDSEGNAYMADHGKKQKVSFWSRLAGRGGNKGKSVVRSDSDQQLQQSPYNRNMIAMKEVYRPSFDDATDSVGHQKASMAGYGPNDGTHRLSYAQQYMSHRTYDEGEETLREYPLAYQNREKGHRSPHDYDQRQHPHPQQQQQHQAHSVPPSSSRQPHYQHAANIGSIYHYPEESIGVDERTAYQTEAQRSQRQRSSGVDGQSAYAMAM